MKSKETFRIKLAQESLQQIRKVLNLDRETSYIPKINNLMIQLKALSMGAKRRALVHAVGNDI